MYLLQDIFRSTFVYLILSNSVDQHLSLSVWLFICLPLCLSVGLSDCLSTSLLGCRSVCMLGCLSLSILLSAVRISPRFSNYLSLSICSPPVCLPVYLKVRQLEHHKRHLFHKLSVSNVLHLPCKAMGTSTNAANTWWFKFLTSKCASRTACTFSRDQKCAGADIAILQASRHSFVDLD